MLTSLQQPAQVNPLESKKLTTKQTKAQKRAAQAEFNRQLWAEACVGEQCRSLLPANFLTVKGLGRRIISSSLEMSSLCVKNSRLRQFSCHERVP